MTNPATTFRALHDGPELLRLANAWDAGSARLVESLGAPAVATTSAGLAWALGYADGGAMPAQAAIGAARNVVRVLRVPLSVDFENGYSTEPAVVAGYVAQLAEAGVAGINLEDGADTPELTAAKAEAIKRAVGDGIFLNLRTDVYLRGLAPEGARVAEVLARAKVYRDAGADGLFVPGLCLSEEIRAVAAAAGLPLNVMDWPCLPAPAELSALGARRLSAGASIAATLWGVARDSVEGFLGGGDPGRAHRPMDYGEIQHLFADRA
jgi:2-methylisocitrate lyase-like PEP mutase family enzyme